jgi:O-antigen ligase
MLSEKNHSRNEKILLSSLLLASLFILTLNLSRGYFLALIIALFPLLYKHSFRKWFVTSSLIGISIVIIFTGTYFISSHGKSFGLETFGLRVKSFTAPQIEESTYTRSALLQPIIEKIKIHPLLGSGFGSTVTFTNPITKTSITTTQFDWGYLELVTEFGLIGFLFYLSFLTSITYSIIRHIQTGTHPDFVVGLLGGLTALLVANLTAPALSHVFGIIFLTGVIALDKQGTSPYSILDMPPQIEEK